MDSLALMTAVLSAVPPPSNNPPSPVGTTAVELLGAGGGLALIALIIKTVMDLSKGRAEKETTRNADLTTQRDTAWRERDDERDARLLAESKAACEVRNARKLWDYAARLRREMIDAGITPKAAEPTLEQCETLTRPPDRR